MDTFSKNFQITNFVVLHPVGTELFHAGGRTDRHDESNRRFSQFCDNTRRIVNFVPYYKAFWDTRWRSWLRHCATSRKVAGSIPDGVIGIFHYHNPSGRIMALGLTQPLTEISTRSISWGVKAAGA